MVHIGDTNLIVIDKAVSLFCWRYGGVWKCKGPYIRLMGDLGSQNIKMRTQRNLVVFDSNAFLIIFILKYCFYFFD